MESLSIGLSSSLSFQNHPKTQNTISKSIIFPQNPFHTSIPLNSLQTQIPFPKKITGPTQAQSLIYKLNPLRTLHSLHYSKIPGEKFPILQISCLISHLSFLCVGLTLPLSCFAADITIPTEEVPNKINLEAILVSIDEFFNRYPFFVAGVTFIWLVVIPLSEEFLQKYKFISAIDAFRKLRDDPYSQLLDVRDKKSLQYLGSPNLKIINKSVVQVEFCEDEDFVKKVLEKFREPSNTVLCILDNFDGNSMKVAELLFKNGFKEAYAIRGGVRGKNGWEAIQETLLPPSVHVYPKENVRAPQQPEMNGGVHEKSNNQAVSSSTVSVDQCEKVENGYVDKVVESTSHCEVGSRPLSPYPNYPDMKPPSSPTPSKP